MRDSYTAGEGASSLRTLELEHDLQLERHARLSAEAAAEKGLRDLYDRQRQLELLSSIATAANASAAPEQALEHALAAICDYTGWEVGHVFVLAPSSDARLCSAKVVFARDRSAVADFIDISLRSEFRPGKGLPGRVWTSGAPLWIADVTRDSNFPRAALAEACGLHAAFAFPLLVGKDVRGVMEFFHSSPLAPDSALLTLAAQIGTQLGRVLERAGAERKLRYEATHDGLTGLPNRATFTDGVSRALSQTGRAWVLAIDLDGFKQVNDTLGHSMGDALLVEVAERLRSRSSNALISRLGGDEFAVLMSGATRVEEVEKLAADIILSLAEPFRFSTAEVCVGASVGIACAPDHGRRLEDLLAAADLALYRAKAEGRHCTRMFNEPMRAAAVRRRILDAELREASLHSQFELYYQPQVRTQDGALVGAEALLRWRHPRQGLQSPAVFLPALETSVLASQTGEWVIRTACAQASEWRRNGVPDFRIGVNLFESQLRSGDLIDVVEGALEQSGLPPEALEVEITENIMLRHDDAAVASLKQLRDLGVSIAFDDYGTGYASFSLLKRYPLNRLKIDRSFVASMCDDPRDAAIVSSVLELGRAFRLNVIAEGVENEQQRSQLDNVGCDEIQGFLFDKPLSPDAFTSKYAQYESGVYR